MSHRLSRLLPTVCSATLLTALAASAWGQARPPQRPLTPEQQALLAKAAPRPADAALFEALGGQAGIARLVDEFTGRLLQDERTHDFFAEADQDNLKLRLREQFCVVSGGPCTYGGKDMRTVHEGQDITKADFNALVEVLQASMRAQGIAFGTQNRLLARLAPMHREVINAR
jgi:hemoglobin